MKNPEHSPNVLVLMNRENNPAKSKKKVLYRINKLKFACKWLLFTKKDGKSRIAGPIVARKWLNPTPDRSITTATPFFWVSGSENISSAMSTFVRRCSFISTSWGFHLWANIEKIPWFWISSETIILKMSRWRTIGYK